MNNDQIGRIGEIQFNLECAKRSLICSWPSIDMNGYDCIIDNGNLIKVQIKSTASTRRASDRHIEQYKLLVQKGKKGRDYYDKTDFDILAIFIHPTNDWYFIPHREIDNRCISINPNSKKSKYIKYKNNWTILIQEKNLQ